MLKSFGSSTGTCTATHNTLWCWNWHFPKVGKTPEQKEAPVLMTLSWWHHPCTQQKLRLHSAGQKSWLATQGLYSNSTPLCPICHPREWPSDSVWGEKPPLALLLTPVQLRALSTGQSHCKHLPVLSTLLCAPCACELAAGDHLSKQTSRDAQCHTQNKPLVQKSGVNINI